jgi:hypothetical protein
MTGGKKLRMTWGEGLAMTTGGHKSPQMRLPRYLPRLWLAASAHRNDNQRSLMNFAFLSDILIFNF